MADTPARLPRAWRAGELALVVLAVIGLVAAAKLAQDFLVPVTAGILIAYALRPLVSGLERFRIPRFVGAAIILALVSGLIAGGAMLVKDDAATLLADLPTAARKLRIAAQQTAQQATNPIGYVREAAAELNRAAAEAVGTPSAPTPQRPQSPATNELQAWGSAQSAKFVGTLAELGLAALLALFLLSAGDTFRRKLVQLAGPTLAARRITVEILDEIDNQVQRYLLVMFVTNALIGAAVWVVLTVLGIERAPMWGAVAAVLHIVPYAGSAITAALIGIAAFMQFEMLSAAAGVALIVLTITAVLGMGFMPWLQGHAAQLNAVAVFVSLLFFGWLWGAWGLLLGAPLMAVLKKIADRVPALGPLGALLGR